MPATARKLTTGDAPVDINEATAQELREALPGIGDILAHRIVAYRNEHGPFESPEDLMRVPGLTGKRLSKFAPRVSLAPNSGFRFQAANETASMSDEYIHPLPIFSIESEPLPQAFSPSAASLFPNTPVESMPASFASQAPEQMSNTFRPSAPAAPYVVGGSLLSPALESLAATPSSRSDALAEEDALHIPLHRPMRVGVALAAIGFFSALVGSAFGIRSQEGGPHTQVAQRVGRVETSVVDLAGSVRALEGQASTFASSINALDARLTRQASGAPAPQPKAPNPVVASADTPRTVESPRDTESRSSVRRRVRQAMRELDAVAPAKPQ